MYNDLHRLPYSLLHLLDGPSSPSSQQRSFLVTEIPPSLSEEEEENTKHRHAETPRLRRCLPPSILHILLLVVLLFFILVTVFPLVFLLLVLFPIALLLIITELAQYLM